MTTADDGRVYVRGCIVCKFCSDPKSRTTCKCLLLCQKDVDAPFPKMRRSFSTSSRNCSRRVVVTGMGVVSPIGVGLKNSWEALTSGKCGITKLDGTEYEKLPCRIGGLIPRGSGPNELNIDAQFSTSQLRTMSMATAYALVASEEALTDAGWKPEGAAEREETGVAVGVGMIDLTDVCNTNDALKRGYSKVSPYFVPRILPNMAAGQISIRYGFRGPNHAVSTACATGAHAIGDAFRFLRNGDANVMVCGGAEACISPLAIAAFCRLRALSTARNNAPHEASRPFDKERDGFVMGEGSAVLVLEELQHAVERNARIYAEILGYGLSGDGAHLTAPREDGSGALLAMKRAIRESRIDSDQVNYVNAHATSTPLGDVIEIKAIRSLFGEHVKNVMLSSTKGAHGHLLGAAGNLEAVFTVMAVKDGLVPPTLNLKNSDCGSDINLVANFAKKWEGTRKRIALKNAFGFGGTNASLCISQYVHEPKS